MLERQAVTSMETLRWKDGYQRQEEREISRTGRDRHTDTELGILLMPGSKTFKRQEKEEHQELDTSLFYMVRQLLEIR